jgi:NAD(P)-dependent dehydrogenase (short-subunit alcohol dehydrogenase family)
MKATAPPHRLPGASAGVGRATAVEFGRHGDQVALLARGRRGLEAAAREVEAAGGTALALETDVADLDQVDSAAATVERELGPIDVWVNNAFAAVFGPFIEISTQEFHRVTEVTYHGFVHGTRAALERMLDRDRGTIVQVGSALAYRGIPLQSAYCGAKHAIQGFHESVRCELRHDGSRVRTTMVQLPAVNTPQFDWALNQMPSHPSACPPDLPARGSGSSDRVRRGPPPSSGVRHRRQCRGHDPRQPIRREPDGPLSRTGYRSQQDSGKPRTRVANPWRPLDAQTAATSGRMGRSTMPRSGPRRRHGSSVWV